MILHSLYIDSTLIICDCRDLENNNVEFLNWCISTRSDVKVLTLDEWKEMALVKTIEAHGKTAKMIAQAEGCDGVLAVLEALQHDNGGDAVDVVQARKSGSSPNRGDGKGKEEGEGVKKRGGLKKSSSRSQHDQV